MDADRERRDAEQPTPARGGADSVLRSAGNHQKLSFLPPPLLSGDRERIHTMAPWYQERLAILNGVRGAGAARLHSCLVTLTNGVLQ